MSTFSRADLYRLLRVSPTASLNEIKASYRRIALEIHPDKHGGCANKRAQFQEVNEAYAVLSDLSRRREYDRANGRRSRYVPPNYRKVYAPAPPPHWDKVWDEQVHYDFHYGDGFQKEFINKMEQEAKRSAEQYKSPLGKGFSFDSDPSQNINPYSKAPQGPPKVTLDYQEIDWDLNSGRRYARRKERIVRDMHGRREERLQRSFVRQRSNATFTQHSNNNANECVIL